MTVQTSNPSAAKEIYHLCVGAIYMLVGIASFFGNGKLIKIFLQHQPLKSPRGILHINLAVTNIGLVSGFILTGTSNFKQRWVFSDFICDVYSLVGMVTGVAEITTVMCIGFENYISACWPQLYRKVEPRHYYTFVIPAIWLNALFWSILPFYGWGSYSLDPAGTTCLINWQTVDEYYTFYMIVFTAWNYVIPIVALWYLQGLVNAEIEKKQQLGNKMSESCDWFSEETLAKMGNWFIYLTGIQWSFFGIVCTSVFLIEPKSIPNWFCTLVPLLAKILSCLFPLTYLKVSPKFMNAMVGLPDEASSEEDEEEVDSPLGSPTREINVKEKNGEKKKRK